MGRLNLVVVAGFIVGLMVAGGCAAGGEPGAIEMETVRLGTLERVQIADGVLLGAQPDHAALRAARDEYGVGTIVNLRPDTETVALGERQFVRALGLDYVSIPFGKPETLTDDVFAAVRSLLRDRDLRPLLVHCSSGNRVGAVWFAYRVLDEGADPDLALAEAKAVGLSRAGHVSRALDYVASQQR